MKTSYAVVHNQVENRFEVALDGVTAVLGYLPARGQITFTHTEVPSALEGRGVGNALVKTGLAYAREQNLKVFSLCWFVDKYRQRHPEE